MMTFLEISLSGAPATIKPGCIVLVEDTHGARSAMAAWLRELADEIEDVASVDHEEDA